MSQLLAAIGDFRLLSRGKRFKVLFMDHNSHPVINCTYKQYKDGLLVLYVLEVENLLMDFFYLVWSTMDKAERILYHTELHWYVTIAVN